MADPEPTAIVTELDGAVMRAGPAVAEAWRTLGRATMSFAARFASAGRRLGTTPVSAPKLRELGLVWPDTAGADEYGRAALVLAEVAMMPAERHVDFVRDLIRRGEVRERQAVLRVLAALPEPARFVDIAVDACRTNVQTIFEAIACDNAYPARLFPDPALYQMVLKALFVGAPVGRIYRLAERTTDELVRMVEAFASERRAAGRPVPDDAKLVTRRP